MMRLGISRQILVGALLLTAIPGAVALGQPQSRQIPEALKSWEAWATWDVQHRDCPTPYNSAAEHFCFWPSTLSLSADEHEGAWNVEITAFDETWVPLPGNAELWPMNVQDGGEALVVVERDGVPFTQLPAGRHQITGEFRWDQLPQKIAVPQQIGILSLTVGSSAVAIPNWDPQGNVWLKRTQQQVAEEDSLTAQVYRVLEDGIPLWLRTEVDLSVSGKSREEDLGWILPEGWILSRVDSPLPVAVDEAGRMKAQVRAGKWQIHVSAFRTTDVNEIRYAPEARPTVDRELVAFRADPQLRLAEIEGLQAVDVTQTTFPRSWPNWRDLPVYEWSTDTSFRLVQKMRGMGFEQPAGLTIDRTLWIDEDGRGLTYQDTVQGQMQRIWRLDVAEGSELGAIRIDGQGQLITENPETSAEGVEVRTRNLQLEAVGRIERTDELPATGWQTSGDSLVTTLMLPPGWRMFALFGADQVEGDWLTAWTLLDLFLLLIFSLAVFRLWGFWAGVVALLAFGLAYHEPGSPRFTWFLLLIPVALLRVTPEGAARRWLTRWKYLAAAALVLVFVPFVARQIQSAIYPQLETPGVNYQARRMFWQPSISYERQQARNNVERGLSLEISQSQVVTPEPAERKEAEEMRKERLSVNAARSQRGAGGLGGARFETSNLQYDPQAKIQTGPALPEWSWNVVNCYFNGPVSAEQKIKPVLIPQQVTRAVTVVRVVLLLVLLGILLGAHLPRPFGKRAVAAALLLCVCLVPGRSYAQLPDQQMLNELRDRLLEPSDAYPHAAEISSATLVVRGSRITMDVEIQAALQVAVPLPGRLPAWSPVSVSLDGQSEVSLLRQNDCLWLVVPAGVHHATVAGLLPEVTEWQWSFLLKPRRVSVDAPDWNVTGIRENSVPENQIFLRREQPVAAGEANYDRRDFHPVLLVKRHLEVGLKWQVVTTVSRLSSPGSAVSVQVPVLPGESVLTSNVEVQNGRVQIQLSPGQRDFTWQSELPVGVPIQLDAAQTEQWVEQWQLVTSPVWNVALPELSPVYEAQQQELVPVWHPWPGELITLSFSKPAAVPGEVMTVERVDHEVSLGRRQRTSQLKLDVQCTLGADFAIGLDREAELSSLKLGEQSIPVRRDDGQVIVPLHPGKQTITMNWRTDETMQTVAGAGEVVLPVDQANTTTVINVPDSRWILWAEGPLRGPAVRFWAVLAFAVLAALVLGSLPQSPLGRVSWVLLALGLTQVHVAAALTVVVWFFVFAWRGKLRTEDVGRWRFDFLQLVLVVLTLAVLGILVYVVGEGLLGDPKMFVLGNGSHDNTLRWFQPRGGTTLPEPYIVSVSVWWYRLLMLFWALWLAAALLAWLKWAWTQFTSGESWKKLFHRRKKEQAATT
jgi:hypothetical protein